MPVFGFETDPDTLANAMTALVSASLSDSVLIFDREAAAYLEESIRNRLADYPEPLVPSRLFDAPEATTLDEHEPELSAMAVLFFNLGRVSEALRSEADQRGVRTVDIDITMTATRGLCPIPPIC